MDTIGARRGDAERTAHDHICGLHKPLQNVYSASIGGPFGATSDGMYLPSEVGVIDFGRLTQDGSKVRFLTRSHGDPRSGS